MSWHVRRVADDFSERYGDLVTGSYDCVNRIVLNAYFPMGHNPGGFRCWWRRLHDGSDDELDNTHLMRVRGPVRAAAEALDEREWCSGDLLQGRGAQALDR